MNLGKKIVLRLLVGGICVSMYGSVNAQFTQSSQVLLSTSNAGARGSISFGDYDNDKDLDLLLIHSTPLYWYQRNLYNNVLGEFTSSGIEPTPSCYNTGYNSSSSFGDYDNDGDLDLLVSSIVEENTCISPYRYWVITHLYQNNITSFTKVFEFQGVDGKAVFGDYDNDGDLDILVSGDNSSISNLTKLYKNNYGTGLLNLFDEVVINIPNLSYSRSKFADYNNDGLLDIFLLGSTSGIYRNTGSGFSLVSGVSFPSFTSGDAIVEDYNNDSYVDVFITGVSSGQNISRLYRNNNSTGFGEVYANTFSRFSDSHSQMADYDNDGDLDLLLSGLSGSNAMTQLYKNNGTGFSFWVTFPGIYKGYSASADVDNDGDLDIVSAGVVNRVATAGNTILYTNDAIMGRSFAVNTAPTAPINIQVLAGNNPKQVVFSWRRSTDNRTPQRGLSYNICVGTSSSSRENIKSSHAFVSGNLSGRRKISQKGEIQDTIYVFNFSKPGFYEWGVQAVDHSFEGSAWTRSASYAIKIPPTLYAATNVSIDSFTISWEASQTHQSYELEVSNVKTFPTVLQTYSTTSTFVNVTDLTPGITYYARVRNVIKSTLNNSIVDRTEYSNITAIDLLKQPQFTELNESKYAIKNMRSGSSNFIDFDNDGDLDLFVVGDNRYITDDLNDPSKFCTAHVYRNNGASGFSEIFTFSGLADANSSFGDYDNDGYIDLFLCGSLDNANVDAPLYAPRSMIYKNTNGTGFIAMTSTSFNIYGVYAGSSSFIDYNADGYLDLVISGSSWNGVNPNPQNIDETNTLTPGATKLYRNNNGTGFSEIQSFTSLFKKGAVSVGDIDSDGDIDFSFTGGLSLRGKFKTYYNNSGLSFQEFENDKISPVYLNYSTYSGSNFYGDYNNDGFLDVLFDISSAHNFRNKTTNSFSLDYDNDGDLDVYSYELGYGTDHYFHFNINKSFIKIPVNGIRSLYNNTSISNNAFGDYDNDGDIDIFRMGSLDVYFTPFSRVYRNEHITNIGGFLPNTVPSAPTQLGVLVSDTIAFRWSHSFDTETPAPALTYNMYIGHKLPGKTESVRPSHSFIGGALDGKRKITEYGMIQDTFTYLSKSLLKPGIYYWGVQAIDQAYAGSRWAESFFTIPPVASISNNNLQFVASWDEVIGAKFYAIEISTDKNFSTIIYKDSTLTTNTKYIQPYLNQGIREYYYRVKAKDNLATTQYSNTVLITTPFSVAHTFLGFVRSTSSFGDYDNDGDLDFFLAGGDGVANRNISSLYKNENGSFLEKTGTGFTFGKIYDGTSSFVDFDEDGDLDIFLAGSYFGKFAFYQNNQTGFTETTSIFPLTNVSGSIKSSFGDYDNDGDLDLFVNGIGTSTYAKLFKNNKTNFTESTGTTFISKSNTTNAFSDYDNDGDLDVFYGGIGIMGNSSSPGIQIYKNNKGIFTKTTSNTDLNYANIQIADYNNDGRQDMYCQGIGISYPYANSRYSSLRKNNYFSYDALPYIISVDSNPLEYIYGGADFGDYDNDGYLDLLTGGTTQGTFLYKNDGTSFIKVFNFEGATNFSKFFDYDNDGDLDILIGHQNSTVIYRNDRNSNTYQVNTPPLTPTGLKAAVANNNILVHFTWNISTDTQTPSASLQYNLFIGTNNNKESIKSSASFIPSGKRKIAERGSIQNLYYTFYTSDPAAGIYYWSVQAIDQSFDASPWAPIQFFIIPPTISYSTLSFNSVTINNPIVNGATVQRMLITQDSTFQFINKDTSVNTLGNPVTINGLYSGTNYFIKLVATDSIHTTSSNILKITTKSSINRANLSIPPFTGTHTSLGDYDDDSDVDILICGSTNDSLYNTRLYTNSNGTAFYLSTGTGFNFIQITDGVNYFVDYDNDELLDIFVSGITRITLSGVQSPTRLQSRFYKNTGSGFIDMGNFGVLGTYLTSAEWGDYDRDGYVDLLLLGIEEISSTSYITKLYKNNNGTSFTDVSNTIIISDSYAKTKGAWTDYDNDGDLDITFGAGQLYKNTNGIFTQFTDFGFLPLNQSSGIFRDFNNDSYVDGLIMGSSPTTGNITHEFYENNGSSFYITSINGFTPTVQASFTVNDYDIDGKLDILVSGYNSSNQAITDLYTHKNTGFVKESFPIDGIGFGSTKMIDYDSDGDFDIFVSGRNSSNRISNIYRNDKGKNMLSTNTAPTIPTTLRDSIIERNRKVMLSWSPSKDSTASGMNQNFVTYNIYIGTKENKNSVRSSQTLPNGKPLLGEMNNTIHTNFFILNVSTLAKPKTYYWSVQAIDATGKASNWAIEDSFSLMSGQEIIFNTLPPQEYLDEFYLGAVSTSGLPITYTTENTSLISIQGNRVVINNIGSGTALITATQSGNQLYYPANNVSQVLYILKRNQSITFEENTLKTFGHNFDFTANTTSGLPISYTSNNNIVSIDGSRATILSVGTVLITASQNGDGNYNAATSVQKIFTITKKLQQIYISTTQYQKTYGEIPFTINATSNSTLPLVYSISNTLLYLQNNTLTIQGAGTVSLSLSQNGNQNYEKADTVKVFLTIHKASQSINISHIPIIKNMGDNAFTLSYSASSGLSLTYSSSNTSIAYFSGNQIYIGSQDGITSLFFIQNGDKNYLPTNASQLIFVSNPTKQYPNLYFVDIPEKTFGDPPFLLGITSNSTVPISYISENTAIVTISNDTVRIIQPGTTNISVYQYGNASYNPQIITKSMRIVKANQSITLAQIPTKTLGDRAFKISASSSSSLPLSFTSSNTNIVQIKKDSAFVRSSGIVIITARQPENNNYNATQATTIIRVLDTLKQNQTIIFAPIPIKIYGGSDFLLSSTLSSGLTPTYISNDTSVATIHINRVTIKQAGTCLISAYHLGNQNLNPTNIVFQTLIVTRANQIISFPNLPPKINTDPIFNITAYSSASLPIIYSSSNIAVASVLNNSVTIINHGIINITAYQTGNKNYLPAFNTQRLIINSVSKTNQTISFLPIPEKIIGHPPFILTASSSSSLLPIEFTSSNPSVATINGNTIFIRSNGTATITAFQEGNTTVNSAIAYQNLVIKIEQSIFATPIPSKIFDDAPFIIEASATSFLPITYSFSNSSIAHLENNTITILQAGTTNVTFFQTGNETYRPASPVSQILFVDKKLQQITMDSIFSKYLGDEPFQIHARSNMGLTVSYSSSNQNVATISSNVVFVNGGGATIITAYQNGNNNYYPATPIQKTLYVSKRPQTLTFNPLINRTWADPPFTLRAFVSSGLFITYSSSNEFVAIVDGQNIILKEPGTTTITAYQNGNIIYIPSNSVSQKLIVEKTNQNITFPNIPVKTFGKYSFKLAAYSDSKLPITYVSSDTKIVNIIDNIVIMDTSGIAKITAYQNGNRFYLPADPIYRTILILPPIVNTTNADPDKYQQTITFNNIPLKYKGDAPFILEAFASSKLPIQYQSSDPYIATVLEDTIIILQSGQIKITAAQPGNPEYNPAHPIIKYLTIWDKNKLPQEIIFQTIPEKTLESPPFTILSQSSANLPITYISSDTTKLKIINDSVYIKNIGIITITALQTGNQTYNPAIPIEQKINIISTAKKNQNIIFETIPHKTVGDPTFLLSARTNSLLPIYFTSSNSNIATIDKKAVNITGHGTVNIIAYQEGNNEYNPATPVSQTLIIFPQTIIQKRNQTIHFITPTVLFYTDVFFTLKATSTSRLPVSFFTNDSSINIRDSIITTVDPVTTPININITAIQTGNQYYYPANPITRRITIHPHPLTPIIQTNNNIKIYPNPTHDIITLKTKIKITKYLIYDILGKLQMKSNPLSFSNNEYKINIKILKPGEYILILYDNFGNIVQNEKIIKQ